MSNTISAQDCQRVKKIVNFNFHILHLYLDAFCVQLYPFLSGGEVWNFEALSKGQLKDFILEVAPYTNERLEEIRRRYRESPEDFYRASPFCGKIYCSGVRERPAYLGHSRVKRTWRVAEKASRRMIDVIFDQIKKRADVLASERASRIGIPKTSLITSLEEQRKEFVEAEVKFLRDLKCGAFDPSEEMIRSARIHDIAGIKAILEDGRLPVLERFFNQGPNWRIAERQEHRGAYNATSYVIELRLDKNALIHKIPDSRVMEVLAARGMDKKTMIEDYWSFVETGEEQVYLEVIATNYPEVIESELGRCMHEERILARREQVEYRSSIARNVRYLTDYLFLFAVSRKSSIEELPVRLWEKTLPDTYDHVIRQLWDIPTMPVL